MGLNLSNLRGLLDVLLRTLPTDVIRRQFGEMILKLEKEIKESKNKWDDLCLPLISLIKAVLCIKDLE